MVVVVEVETASLLDRHLDPAHGRQGKRRQNEDYAEKKQEGENSEPFHFILQGLT
jgi:hypothetical protein